MPQEKHNPLKILTNGTLDIKSIHSTGDIVKRIKKEVTVWEKIITHHTLDKGPLTPNNMKNSENSQ